jgi:hypothetical protein
VQAIGRLGRRAGVGTGVGVGALSGAGLGLYIGGIAALLLALSGGPWLYVALIVLPLSVLGGGFLGARLFLWFRTSATGLRLRHRRFGALIWGLGGVLFALLALIGIVAGATAIDVALGG